MVFSKSRCYKPEGFSLGHECYSKVAWPSHIQPCRNIHSLIFCTHLRIQMVELPWKVLNKGNRTVNGKGKRVLNILHQSSMASSMWQSKPSEATPLGCEIQFLRYCPLTIAAGSLSMASSFFPPAVVWLPFTATGTKALYSSAVEATMDGDPALVWKHCQAGIKDLQWSYSTSRKKKGCNRSSRRWDITRRLKTEIISCHCRHTALTLAVNVCDWQPEKSCCCCWACRACDLLHSFELHYSDSVQSV